ncbi:MAG: serine hydrolase domain-containing protein [Chthoniobacteraceae bacterium]
MWRNTIFLTIVMLGRLPAEQSAEDISVLLEPIRNQYQLPALTAAAVINGKIVSLGTAGARRLGDPTPATNSDLWHIGSCTKSMTATLAAGMIEEGLLRWDSTISETIPTLKGALHPDWEKVTLEQLLTNRSGAPGQAPGDLWKAAWKQEGSPAEQRMTFVRGLASRPPEAPPGTRFIYSNQGFSIAGAMLETVAGEPFETLLTRRLFEPLGMKSAGFGAPGEPGRATQPWGHARTGGEIQPIPPGPKADNPPAITPAGRVHLSIADFARYAGWHAQGANARPSLLSAESMTKLHTAAEGQDYAMGWGVAHRAWAAGETLSHTGSNNSWFAVMWVAPARGAAFVAATNIGGEAAAAGTDAAVAALIQKHLR